MSQFRTPPRRRVDGVLLLDKPAGMTSNAALQKARRLLNAAKAGHTGTLDPLATGLLPLCFGEATKFAGELLGSDKRYVATLCLGVRTDTGDAEGQVLATRPVAVVRETVEAVLIRFRGNILQVPPMHSALKRAGRPLYEYARQGIEVERQPREVRIFSLTIDEFAGNRLVLDVECSKGTYVRTLAEDMGEALGCGAHLTALRRTRIGPLRIENALSLETLEAQSLEERTARLHPVDSLMAGLPSLQLDPAAATRFGHGQTIQTPGEPSSGSRRVYAEDGRFLGLAALAAGGLLKPVRLMAITPEK